MSFRAAATVVAASLGIVVRPTLTTASATAASTTRPARMGSTSTAASASRDSPVGGSTVSRAGGAQSVYKQGAAPQTFATVNTTYQSILLIITQLFEGTLLLTMTELS